MTDRVVYDSARPKGERFADQQGRPYSRGWRDCSAKVVHWLRRGATADDIGRWMDGPLRDWIERGDPNEKVPDIGGQSS